jgi:hypothetical protein
MLRRVFILGLSCAAFALPLTAAAEDNLMDEFEGTWISLGDAFGKPAQSRMIWSHDLNENFYKLTYQIHMGRGTEKAASFDGVGYYRRTAKDTWTGVWADSSGDIHKIKASRDGDAMVSRWGEEGAKLGRTRYELIAPDKIKVTDWIHIETGWHKFNENEFKKRAQAPATKKVK